MYLTNLTVKNIENIQLPNKVFAYQAKIDYIIGKNLDKTHLLNYTNINNFSKLEEKQYRKEDYKLKIEVDIDSIICVNMCCNCLQRRFRYKYKFKSLFYFKNGN